MIIEYPSMYPWYNSYGVYAYSQGRPDSEKQAYVEAMSPYYKEDSKVFMCDTGKILPREVWLNRVSKQLSWVLRHRASALRLSLRPDGAVPLLELLSLPTFRKLQVSLHHVVEIVSENKKARFAMWDEGGVLWIRANQGHSIAGIDDAFLLQEIQEPLDVCCHGTYTESWDTIRCMGLLLMGRNHIHFTPYDPQVYDLHEHVGMRRDIELYIFVDMARAMKAGIRFFYSDNGVVLTRGDDTGALSPEFFAKVIDTEGKVLFEQPASGETEEARDSDLIARRCESVHPVIELGNAARKRRERRKRTLQSTDDDSNCLRLSNLIPSSASTNKEDKLNDMDDASTSASVSPTNKIAAACASHDYATSCYLVEWNPYDYDPWALYAQQGDSWCEQGDYAAGAIHSYLTLDQGENATRQRVHKRT